MELNFELKVNSSEFIEKTEQIRSAMRTTALEIEEQGQKVSSSFQQMADKVSFTTDIVGKAIQGMQEQIIAAIASLYELDSENQSRLAGLRKDFGESLDKDSSDEQNQKTSVSKEIDSRENLSEDINNQSKELAQLNAELLDYQQKLEAVQNELSGLKTEMSTVSEEMKEMHDAGQQNTETYAALQKKSEDLSESMKKISADDTFEGITSGLEGLSGAFSTASSMLELFSIENETLQKIMQKVQLAIAITNGLQEVNAVLSKNSAFQLNVVGQLKLWWRNITLQAAAAQGIETAAASTGTVVNLGLAGSFRAIGLAIKSIPVIGWILAGISALIGLYSLWSSHTEEQKKEQEELNESVKKFNDNIQNYAAKPIATIELLSTKFRALGNDMDAQLKFIVDNKNAFDELGYSINSVKDAQQLLIDNKDKFIEAQIAKATSLAYGDMVKEDAKEYAIAKKEQEKWEKVAKEEEEKDRQASRIPTLDGMPAEDRTSTQDGLSRLKRVPIKTTKNPASRQESEMLQEQGLLSETGGLLRPSEIKARSAKERADEIYKKMQASSEQSLFADNKANEILAGMMLNKKKSTPEDDTKNIEESHEKYMSLLEKQKAERIRFAEDSVNRIKQAEIDANADGSEKTFEQLELNQKKERQALEREKQELIQRRKEEAKAVFDAEQNAIKAIDPKHKIQEFVAPEDLSTDIEKEFRKRTSSLDKKQLKERLAYYDSEKQAMNEYLKEYGTYIEKRNAIIALGESKKKGKNEGEQMIIAEETKKALSDLDIEANKDKSAFGQLFSNMKDRSVKDMRAIVAEAQNMLNFVEKGEWSDSKGELFHISKETFDVLKKSPQEIEKIKNGIEDLNDQANASDTALNKMSIGFDHLFAAGSDPGKLKKALGEIGDSMNEVLQSTKFFSDCLAGLGDAFGSDALSGIAEGMNVAMDAASSAMSGAQAGAMFGPWGAAAGAAIGLVSSLGSSLAKLHDAKHEKSIQRIQEQIEVLERTYDNLGDSLDKAFSSDASELIDQQNTLLEQQKVLIRNQIAEEKSKKKTDWGRIDEWEKQIEDIDKVIAGNKEKKIDVIFGEDLKAAIENFAQAYAEAWSAGDDKAKSSKDLVKNMIKQMITEAIKAASSKPMEALRQKLAGFFSDGIISDWERLQIEKDAEAIARDLDKQFGWADEYMKGDEKESSSQDSTKGGFASMSQETGDELNGRFTAMQISNEEIKNSMVFVLGNLSSLCMNTSNGNLLLTEMRNLAVMSNGHLEDIAKYTKVLLGFGEKLDNIAYNTKSLTVK